MKIVVCIKQVPDTAEVKLDPKTNAELLAAMWEPFCGLGKYEAYVIDTTKQTAAETAAAIKACVRSGENRIR